jgi:hypothetical protein
VSAQCGRGGQGGGSGTSHTSGPAGQVHVDSLTVRGGTAAVVSQAERLQNATLKVLMRALTVLNFALSRAGGASPCRRQGHRIRTRR